MNPYRFWMWLGLVGIGLSTAVHSLDAFADPAANAAPAPPSADAKPAAPPVKHLDIWEFDVDGNTVLDEETIENATAPFLGPGQTTDAVDKAREALENAYREHGFKTVSVAIPRQNVRDGVVVLQVTEGRVGHLNVVGSKYHSIDQIKEEAPALSEGNVPDFTQVQKDIVALNQQPDRRVTPALKAGATPGTVDVDLVVDDHLPLHGSLELNNRKSQDTSDLRAIASFSYDNLWQLGHSLSFSYQTAPQNTSDSEVFFGSYLVPLQASPWSLLFNGLKTNSSVATVGGINVVGNGYSSGFRAVRQMEGHDGFYPSISLGVDYKNFKTVTQLGTASFETPVKYYPVSLGYTALSRNDTDQAQGDVTVGFASPEFGSDTSTIQLNRFRARGQMFYLRGNISDKHDFTNGLEYFVRISGQMTDQPLISNEQFSAGGMDTARGYLEAEALGDYGFGETIEFRSPSLGDHISFGKTVQPVQDLRLFAFVDGAELRLRGPLPDSSTPNQVDLLSVGIGLSLKLYSYFYGVVDWADPLLDGPTTRAHDSRVLFRVWTSF